jgi:Na+-translocating ferredoxin:NAD+ oxidoreductase RnfG subunit
VHIINTTQKEKEMKKSVRLGLIIVAAVAAISTTVAASTFIQSNEKLHELERAARLQNLSVIAVNNKDYALACKSQTEAEKALFRANLRSDDVLGMLDKSSSDLCSKAAKVIASK